MAQESDYCENREIIAQ